MNKDNLNNNTIKNGYILDYISNKQVKATPEEIEAVQIFSKQLVEDYGYPKNLIQTHLQFRVKIRPSDTKKEYPIDIAVFNNQNKIDDDLYIIVECKKKNRKDGLNQLQDYLRFSKAKLGVWFNGDERIFIKKYERDGEILFENIPNIPNYKQRLEDIGQFRKKDLKKTHNLKTIFKTIRNHLAGNSKGATRDETLAKELINIIFCKIYDEKHTEMDKILEFRSGINEKPEIVASRIKNIFINVKNTYDDLFEKDENIKLDNNSINYIVGELQNYYLMETERDVISDAFETFIGHALKGEQGQFFTPRNIVKAMVEIMEPNKKDYIIDPACGSGGFLIESLRHIWKYIDIEGQKYNWNINEIQNEKSKVAINNICGIDNDNFLAKVTKVYMTLIGDGKSGIMCDDTLENCENWKEQTKLKIKLNNFDIVLTNPPFGKSIKVTGDNKLKQYDLAYNWKKCKNNNEFVKTKIKKEESPEILFIERCLQLLKNNGRMGIVLPDGIFNESESYIRAWLLKRVKILGIIDMCKETFQPNTSTKTSLLFFEKTNKIPDNYDIFMGIAYYCGHNRRGEEIEKDDIKEIIDNYKKWKNGITIKETKNCFIVQLQDLKNTDFWTPKHFSPYYKSVIDSMKHKNIEFITLKDIADIKSGDEVGSKNYIDFFDKKETDIPFIRTGDLANFQVNQIPDKFVDEKIYKNLNQDLQADDILFTKDGKIGITAVVMKNDKIIISSGIERIRLNKNKMKEKNIYITPEYLFVVLSNKWVGYFQALRNTVVAATIPHLRECRLSNFEIPILDKKSIDDITNIVKKSFELKNESIKLDKKAIELFK